MTLPDVAKDVFELYDGLVANGFKGKVVFYVPDETVKPAVKTKWSKKRVVDEDGKIERPGKVAKTEEDVNEDGGNGGGDDLDGDFAAADAGDDDDE